MFRAVPVGMRGELIKDGNDHPENPLPARLVFPSLRPVLAVPVWEQRRHTFQVRAAGGGALVFRERRGGRELPPGASWVGRQVQPQVAAQSWQGKDGRFAEAPEQ